jgi:hypothetical protein
VTGAHRPRPGRHGVVVGLAVVGVYVGTALLTPWLSGRAFRPLFDGFAPPSAYQWVRPPQELRAGNIVPKESVVSVTLGPAGNQPDSVSSADGQFTLNLPAGALPPAEAQTTATFTITPLDAATLSPLPGLFADGNAYRLQVVDDPSGRALDALAQPANAVLVVPQPAEAIWFSADGRSWRRLDTQSVSNSTAATVVSDMGYYLAGAAAAVGDTGAMSDLARTLVVVGGTAVLALGLWLTPVVLRRRREAR